MKEIKLNEILEKFLDSDRTKQSILQAMKEACNQTVDLCAENARICFSEERYSDPWRVNKESILNTKNLILELETIWEEPRRLNPLF